jgi:hypothetical protein
LLLFAMGQVGFLYLRYICNPNEIWQWVKDYVDDSEVRELRLLLLCARQSCLNGLCSHHPSLLNCLWRACSDLLAPLYVMMAMPTGV